VTTALRLLALRLLMLATIAVIGLDCGTYLYWPASLGVGAVLAWLVYCAYLYARSFLPGGGRP
jgi:hypothetical protein